MKSYISFSFLLCIFSSQSLAQKQGKELANSLEKKVQEYRSPCARPCIKDSIKVNLLNDIAYELRDDESALRYLNAAILLSKEIEFAKGAGIAYVTKGTTFMVLGEYDSAIINLDKGIEICKKTGNKRDEAWGYQSKGSVYDKQGNYDEALKLHFLSLAIRKPLGNKRIISASYNNIAAVYISLGKYKEALDNFFLALEIQKGIIDKPGMAGTYSNIGLVNSYQSNYIEADKNYTTALEIYKELDSKSGICNAYINIGYNLQSQGKFRQALANYTTAIQILESGTKDKYMLAFVQNNIGAVYNEMGNYESALSSYLSSVKLREEIGDKAGIAQSNSNIGYVYQKILKFDEALKYYTKALVIDLTINNKRGIAERYNAIANIKNLQGDNSAALVTYKKALEIFSELDDKKFIAIVLDNLGIIYHNSKNNSEALKNHSEALKIRRAISDSDGIASTYINIAEIFKEESKFDTARKYYNESVTISKKIGKIEFIKDSYLGLSDLDSLEASSVNDPFKKAESWMNAYNNFKNYTLYKDSLFNTTDSVQLNELLVKYETENKQKEIEILQKDKKLQDSELKRQKLIRNSIGIFTILLVLFGTLIFLFYKRRRDAEQKQKETELSLKISETEMKALRSQMNPHFIFNALQSIQSFLLNHKSEDANIYLLKFSNLMRLVLENSQYGQVALEKDIEALKLYMELESIRLNQPFRHSFHIDQSINPQNTLIPPLLLQPFVENAIWHGLQYKKESGNIDIYISKNNSKLTIAVEDNGVGRNTSKSAIKPFLYKKESLGLKLTEDRLKILNENFKANAGFVITDLFNEKKEPTGTRVELSLPLIYD